VLNGDVEIYTNIDGSYGFPDLQCGLCYSVIPSSEGFDFEPPSYTYCPLLGVVEGQDFTAVPVSLVSDELADPVRELRLYPCRPNPLSISGTIRFDLPRDATVKLRVYSATGRCVGTLVDNQVEAGRHSVEWIRVGPAGNTLEPGLYFLQLETLSSRLTTKTLVVQ